MHELSFSETVCAPRHVVLKLPLSDFSIGHNLLLSCARNPLLWSSDAHFNALPFEEQVRWLIEAVLVCATSYKARKKLNEPSVFGWRARLHLSDVALWHWFRKFGAHTDWAAEIALFRNYINSSRVITNYDQRREGFPFLPCTTADGATGRALGGPYEAALIQFLIAHLRLTEEEALEYPLGAAQMHYLTHMEREGALKIINAAEMAFEEDCRAQDEKAAKEAGFDTVEDYSKHLQEEARAKKEKQKQAEQTAPDGLATELPAELLATKGEN